MEVHNRKDAVHAYSIGKTYIAKFGIGSNWRAYDTLASVSTTMYHYYEGDLEKGQSETEILCLEEILFGDSGLPEGVF